MGACAPSPTEDPVKLRAIAKEAHFLISANDDQVARAESEGRRPDLILYARQPTIESVRPNRLRFDTQGAAPGLYIVVHEFFVEEAGYFIPKYPQRFVAPAGGDPSFRPLGEGVFWYEIKG
jgi:hypothetical protein